jgi:DNA (cytosine-5)-methyltransferase 1
MNYYNEIDPFAAQWLRNLIKAGHIAPGDVDERSILDVPSIDLTDYDQCHLFAGIGGWSYALRLAGWPDDQPVWTGSAPCQPFSTAGKGEGFADDRHLWPAFFWHIRQCQPPIIFGEQVSGPLGRQWWDVVATDLESAAYACTAFDLPAASVGAFHKRQRLFWVAHAAGVRYDGRWSGQASDRQGQSERPCDADPVAHASSEREWEIPIRQGRQDGNETARIGGRGGYGEFWSTAEWLPCFDGKARPIEPGVEPLAHGVSGRVGRLRGYGNAIVPQVAAVFIEAFMETRP